MVEYLELSIDEMLLDQDNPRLGSVSSQSEALEKLIDLSPAHFRKMMQSIKNNGLDPGDSLYVIEAAEHGDYEVLEGNRRLSALKVLSNPEILKGTSISDVIKKSLSSLSSGFDRTVVEPIRCVQFKKREDANDWIYRRHTGTAEGEGRITWGPIEIDRFTGDHSILDVIDFVGRNADYTPQEWQSTKEMIESRKSTNLGRLLESAYGRKHIGLSVRSDGVSKTPMLSSDPIWALQILKKLIEDVRDGLVDSRDLNKASDIEDYFKSLPLEYQRTEKLIVSPKAFKDISIKPTLQTPTDVASASNHKPSEASKPKQKVALAPKPRVMLAPKAHPFKPPISEKGRRLLREATKINANEFALSSAFILRAFVELAVSEYMKANSLPLVEMKGGKAEELDASQRADRVKKDIIAKGTFKDSDLRPFNSALINKPSPTSIQSLNGFVHSKFAIPTPDALRAGWDASVPVFIATYGAV